MKKLMMAILSVMLVSIGITANHVEIKIDRRTLPEKIVSTVLAVEQSSGIIVYSDEERALVLTAYHTIDDEYEKAACCGCDYDIDVKDKREGSWQYKSDAVPEKYHVNYIEINEKHDLAIIEIDVPRKLDAAEIGVDASLGEDIYIASNPKGLYRSLKKGIVSSEFRKIMGSPNIEIDAGIIFGSSGGGVFNMDGELVGIVKAVRLMDTGHCFDVWGVDGEWEDIECVEVPLPFIGFAVHPVVLRHFLLKSVFSDEFKYLK